MNRREFVALSTLAGIGSLAGCNVSSRGNLKPKGSARLTARASSPRAMVAAGLHPLGVGDARGQLYVPRDHVVGEPLPLLVLLHGAGGSSRQWFGSYGDRAEGARMIILAPESKGATWDLLGGELGPDIERIDKLLGATFDKCSVDPSRIAVGGFSDGASYALSVGLANGDLFNRVVAFSPGVLSIEERTGKPGIFISHATDDTVLPFSNTKDFVARLRAMDYATEFLEFTGGHAVPASVSDAAFRWLAGGSISASALGPSTGGFRRMLHVG